MDFEVLTFYLFTGYVGQTSIFKNDIGLQNQKQYNLFFKAIDSVKGRIEGGIKKQIEEHDVSENGRVESSKSPYLQKKQQINRTKSKLS